MPSHIRFTVLTLVTSLTFVVGCSQSSSPEGEQASVATSADSNSTSASKSGEPTPAEPEGEMPAEPAADGSVKLATAETPLKAAGEAAKPPQDPNAPDELPAVAAIKRPLPHDNVDSADLTMAPVKLTDHHKATCLVNVGDAFPAMNLADMNGQSKPLAEQLGQKLTLVFFWTSKEPTSLEQLADLALFHQPRFGDQGLTILAVNTGDPAPQAAEMAKKANVNFAVLSDADGAAFKQVATAKLPRTYLLDANGKILWFDLEYSATTRRDMVQAIRFSLAHL